MHVTDERVLVVNRSQVDNRSHDAEVVTIRDRTELQGALGELSSLQVLTDSLRSQAHEAANKLHTVITMVEMGRADEAVKFATNELELSQRLVDRLSDDVGEPALVALLLGKTAQADERGIELSVTEDTHLPSNADDVPLSGQEMVTVLRQPDRQRDGRVRPRRPVGRGHRQPGRPHPAASGWPTAGRAWTPPPSRRPCSAATRPSPAPTPNNTASAWRWSRRSSSATTAR